MFFKIVKEWLDPLYMPAMHALAMLVVVLFGMFIACICIKIVKIVLWIRRKLQ